MSELIDVYALPATYKAMPLTTYTDMADAIEQMGPLGYTGNMSKDATGAWQMWFSSNMNNGSFTAKIGDYIIVKNGSIVSSVPAATAGALYSTTPPA